MYQCLIGHVNVDIIGTAEVSMVVAVAVVEEEVTLDCDDAIKRLIDDTSHYYW